MYIFSITKLISQNMLALLYIYFFVSYLFYIFVSTFITTGNDNYILSE